MDNIIKRINEIEGNYKEIDKNDFEARAKVFQELKREIPDFEKFEFFYLVGESFSFRKYLMDNNIVNRSLLTASSDDYKLYRALKNKIIDDSCNDICTNRDKDTNEVTAEFVKKVRAYRIGEFYRECLCDKYFDCEYNGYVEDTYDSAVWGDLINDIEDKIYNKVRQVEDNENASRYVSKYNDKLVKRYQRFYNI